MNRHVVAGCLVLALAGCAQSRSALSRNGPSLPPAELTDMPSIHESIVRGVPPSEVARLSANRTPSGSVGMTAGPPATGMIAAAPRSGAAPNAGTSAAPSMGQVAGDPGVSTVAAAAPTASAAAPTPQPNAPATVSAAAPAPQPNLPTAASGAATASQANVPATTGPAPLPAASATADHDATKPAAGGNPSTGSPVEPALPGPEPVMPPKAASEPSRPTEETAPAASTPEPAANPTTTVAPTATPSPSDPAPQEDRDPLLGASPDVMPPMDVIPAAKRKAKVTTADPSAGAAKDGVPSGPPASETPNTKSTASSDPAKLPPADGTAKPAPENAPDPLLGSTPDVMPPMDLPPGAGKASSPPKPEPTETAPPAEPTDPVGPVELPPPTMPPASKPGTAPAPAEPIKGSAARSKPGRDSNVRPASADSTMMRSDVKATRNLHDADSVVAIVGEELITIHELTVAARAFKRKHVPQGVDLSESDKYMLANSALQNLIERSLIVQEAKRKIKSEKSFAKFMEIAVKAFREEEVPHLMRKYHAANEHELKEKLAEDRQCYDDMLESFKLDFLAKGFMEQAIGPKMKIDWPEMRDYYNAHLKDFDRPAQIVWREILVEVERSPNRAAARKRADAILAKLLHGEDFEKVAKAESDGPNKSSGGLWEITPGSYGVESVNQVLKDLPQKQVSRVIEGPESFHIVRVESRREAGPARFDEVQDEVREAIHRVKVGQETNAFIEKLKSQSVVRTFLEGSDDSAAAKTPGADRSSR